MTLRQVEVFCAVARHESMKLAARELHLSHSTISGMMTMLQNDLRCDLLAQSTKRGTPLTPDGWKFFAKVALPMIQVREALQEIKRGAR